MLTLDGAAELADEREQFLNLSLELDLKVGLVGEQLGDLLAEVHDFVFE